MYTCNAASSCSASLFHCIDHLAAYCPEHSYIHFVHLICSRAHKNRSSIETSKSPDSDHIVSTRDVAHATPPFHACLLIQSRNPILHATWTFLQFFVFIDFVDCIFLWAFHSHRRRHCTRMSILIMHMLIQLVTCI